jgi:hypothetical protein
MEKRTCCVCGVEESPSQQLWYRDVDTDKVYCLSCWDRADKRADKVESEEEDEH